MKEYSAEARKFYKSTAWQKCKASYIKHVGGLCERCLAKGLIVPGYIVHHKSYIDATNVDDPSITLNWDNLEYLCLDCHNSEHFTKKIRRYRVLADGSVEISPPSQMQ